MKMRYFNLAQKMSFKSDHKQHLIGGCLVKKNKIISLGFNKVKTHPKSNSLHQHIHCELDCILGIDKELLEGATLYLYRQNKQGVPSICRPCRFCEVLLKEVKIKKVCYTDNNTFKEELI